jgi:hypothetical protein
VARSRRGQADHVESSFGQSISSGYVTIDGLHFNFTNEETMLSMSFSDINTYKGTFEAKNSFEIMLKGMA